MTKNVKFRKKNMINRSTSNKALKELKKKKKDLRKQYLDNINITLYDAREKNTGRIPYKMIHKII